MSQPDLLENLKHKRKWGGEALASSKMNQILHDNPSLALDIIDSSSDCIKVLDLEGRLIFMNKAGQRRLKIKDIESVLGKKWSSFWKNEDHTAAKNAIEAARNGEQGDFLGYCPTTEGDDKWWDVVVTPIVNPQLKPEYLLAVSRDFTAKVAAENARTRAKVSDASNKLKSQFIAHVSHEIRSPLSAIQGFAQLLRNPKIDRLDQDHFIDIILRSCAHLNSLIGDILDLSKIEAGELKIKRQSICLHKFFADTYESVKIKADKKNISVRVSFADNLPDVIYSDPVRLKQIMINLFNNSLKFTSEGSIDVSVKRREQTDENGRVMIGVLVQDSGIGIPKEQQSHIFSPFAQVDEGTSRKFGGSGLGLTISKNLARMLGGDLRLVESTEGVGSIFELTFDASEAVENRGEVEKVHSKKRAPSRLEGRRFLVAEDSVDIRLLLQILLENEGATVTLVENGLEAVEVVSNSDDLFDAVLMDIQMPVMDGCTATRELRRIGFEKSIFALTAQAMDNDKKLMLDAGCDDVITKPIDIDYFCEVLNPLPK